MTGAEKTPKVTVDYIAPCPYCDEGGEDGPTYDFRAYDVSIGCPICGFYSPGRDDMGEAQRTWNELAAAVKKAREE